MDVKHIHNLVPSYMRYRNQLPLTSDVTPFIRKENRKPTSRAGNPVMFRAIITNRTEPSC